ncbi:MAG: alpha-amylase family glycosyl hydrolase [Acidobacteriaceae bacterium]
MPPHLLSFAVLLLTLGPPAHAQSSSAGDTTARNAALTLDKPTIAKIDPPNWWSGMPNPMLLMRGEHLGNATFTVGGSNVPIVRKQVSANGHWAFLWLDTARAEPGTLTIRARNAAGEMQQAFVLDARRPANTGFAGFSAADVLYLIMPDRFADGDRGNDSIPGQPADDRAAPRAYHGGDLRGIVDHLDYLRQLGVTAVWTTPLYDNSANHSGDTYHGYSATDMYAVDPHLGTLADYRQLAAALHARGMKYVLDTVPNHVGPHHPWVTDEPTPDWFHGTAARHIAAVGDFASIVDPHGTERDRIPPLDGWFADVLPDLNQENPLVATYLIQNAEWWIETAGLDGLRLDTFPYVGRAFWHDFHAQIHALYPRLTAVGEVMNQDPTITSYFAGGESHAGIDTGLYTPFDYPAYFALRAALTRGEPMTKLAAILRQDSLYPHPERLVPFEGNHDTKRFLSEPGATPAELKLAFGLLATLRGMPEIYSGDEIAMRGGDDPDNRRDFPGGFPNDPQNAFTTAGRMSEQAAMHDWVADLFHFRRLHPALRTGQLQLIFADKTAIAYVRTPSASGCLGPSSGERYLVVLNNADKPRQLALDTNETSLAGCTRFSAAIHPASEPRLEGARLLISLPPKGMAVYSAGGDTQVTVTRSISNSRFLREERGRRSPVSSQPGNRSQRGEGS